MSGEGWWPEGVDPGLWVSGGRRAGQAQEDPAASGPADAGLLRFAVLGPLRVSRGGRPLPVPTAKPLAVLAVLLARHGRPVRVEEIVDTVWPDDAPASATNLVQKYAGQLRRLFGTAPDGPPALNGGGYVVDATAQVDLSWFRSRVGEVGRVADPAARLRSLLTTLEAWRGPAFANVSPQVRARPMFDGIDDEYLAAACLAADLAAEVGRHELALPALRRAVGWRPLDESVLARWVVALAGSGRQAEALDAYEQVRRRLGDELGVDPGPQLRDAHLLVLRHEWTVGATAGATALARTTASTPAQLPADTTDFTGRQAAVQELVEVLTGPRPTGAPPICAISGPGGVGKTALAIHVGHRVAGHFPDGCLYVDLHGLGDEPADPGHVLAAMLRSLGVADLAIPAPVDERAALFRTVLNDRRVLVVLDNAADERQVRPLLPASAGCGAVVTGRSSLGGLPGARLLRLGVFEPDQAVALLAATVGAGRVAAEPAAAVAIARGCGCLPLAVRIAAARLLDCPQWPLATLARRLADDGRRLDELARADQEVRATVGWSYRSLPGAARRGLRLLAFLDAEDVTAWTTAALLDVPPDTADTILADLTRASLLDVSPPRPGTGPRYRMHDLIRHYARERCLAEDTTADRRGALTRTVDAWLRACVDADAGLAGTELELLHGPALAGAPEATAAPADPARWFDAERGNHLALVRQACRLGLVDHAWDLAASAVNLYRSRQCTDLWRASHELCLAACRDTGNELGEAVLLRNLTELHYLRPGDDPAAGIRRSLRAARLFHASGEARGEADVLAQAAVESRLMADLETGLAYARRSLSVARSHGYRRGEAQGWRVIGRIHLAAGRYDDAVRCAARGRELAQATGCLPEQAHCLHLLGLAQDAAGHPARAMASLGAAIHAHRADGSRYDETRVQLAVGELQARTGDPQARTTLTGCHSFFTEIGARIELAKARRALADLDRREGAAQVAADSLGQVLRTWRELGNLPEQASTLEALGHALADAGDAPAAAGEWRAAIKRYDRLGNRARADDVAAALHQLAARHDRRAEPSARA